MGRRRATHRRNKAVASPQLRGAAVSRNRYLAGTISASNRRGPSRRRGLGAPTVPKNLVRQPNQQYLPTAVRETEARWRALINLVPEPADAPERQSFELLRNDCPCEQRD
jgi:hypothetical protein